MLVPYSKLLDHCLQQIHPSDEEKGCCCISQRVLIPVQHNPFVLDKFWLESPVRMLQAVRLIDELLNASVVQETASSLWMQYRHRMDPQPLHELHHTTFRNLVNLLLWYPFSSFHLPPDSSWVVINESNTKNCLCRVFFVRNKNTTSVDIEHIRIPTIPTTTTSSMVVVANEKQETIKDIMATTTLTTITKTVTSTVCQKQRSCQSVGTSTTNHSMTQVVVPPPQHLFVSSHIHHLFEACMESDWSIGLCRIFAVCGLSRHFRIKDVRPYPAVREQPQPQQQQLPGCNHPDHGRLRMEAFSIPCLDSFYSCRSCARDHEKQGGAVYCLFCMTSMLAKAQCPIETVIPVWLPYFPAPSRISRCVTGHCHNCEATDAMFMRGVEVDSQHQLAYQSNICTCPFCQDPVRLDQVIFHLEIVCRGSFVCPLCPPTTSPQQQQQQPIRDILSDEHLTRHAAQQQKQQNTLNHRGTSFIGGYLAAYMFQDALSRQPIASGMQRISALFE